MRKIFHEAPNSIFKQVQRATSGDYALVHLFEENKEYLKLFEDAVKKGREVILDNSVYELGDAFNNDSYSQWIEHLKPTWFIIPDVPGQADPTLERFHKFMFGKLGDFHRNVLNGEELRSAYGLKTIAVAHGQTFSEFMKVFIKFHEDPRVDMIAIPFIAPFYLDFPGLGDTPVHKLFYGRIDLVKALDAFYQTGYFTKPVHLLGATLPQEGLAYRKMKWIYSTDTSNPVVAALENMEYTKVGLNEKPKTKLFTLIDREVTEEELARVKENIKTFKYFWKVSK